ncbi:unnamed protein product [Alopecurus aequalis]
MVPVCLNSITIKSGACVYSLEFSYSDEYGVPHHAGPWGGDVTYLKAGVVNTIQFGPTEFLMGISGTILGPSNHYGYPILQSLMFITNARHYGPFGEKTGDHFHSPMSSNSSIVGFFARSGDIVDAIGLYVKIEREPIEKQDSITKVGPWGGDWGQDHYVDVVPRRLISVVVCSGEVIDSLTFIYIDHDGHQHTAGPWGGLGMSKKGAFHTIMLGRSEIVKEVYGTIGPNTITSLSFVTNITTYGPFGDGDGTQFRSPVQDNDSIVGFFAKAGKHIDAIGFYLASIDKQDNDGDPSTNPKLEDDTKNKEYITKIGPWGGCKGNHKDVEVAPLCLNSVTICSGKVVFSLAFSYNDAYGKQHHAGPWGASEGFSSGSFYTIQLGPSEFLIEVSGTIGSSSKYSSNVISEVSGTTDFSSDHSSDVVTSILFITNVHRHGPFGRGGGIPFHSPVLSCGSIVGFFAHADRAVDAIGLYVNPESKPTKEQDSVMKIGPWGGDLGSSYDVDVLPRRLISVVVHSGKVINTLTFTYSDCNGQEHTAGPWGRTGEPTDGSSHQILLGPSDFLMEVSGTIGRSSEHSEVLLGQYDFLMEVSGTIGRSNKNLDVVQSLLFVTNTGSYGPYGEGGGTHFRSPLQTDGSIVGFFVNVEDMIHAIGVYFRPERNAYRDKVDIQSASSVLEHIILDGCVEPTNVPLALLQKITEDFSEKREIGRGGFGVVYKGDLKNGSVAVKRLLNSHTIDEALFYREATSMISVKHENIVRLLGYCANTECKAMKNPDSGEETKYIFAEIRERILCFEYIKNGSLDKYLNNELTGLEWHTRYQIIMGVCNGLDYLHNEKGIIHKDLKPANILVDDLMVPKITDFGISKFLDGATHAVTSNSTMSLGYSAPEFVHHGLVSYKSDIYSLGVIMVELMTARKGNPDVANVLRRWRHRWNKSLNYPPLGIQQVSKCIEIALTCLSFSPNERPHVREILPMLNEIESTGVQINCVGESSVGPISPYPWELLEFDKLELNFPFEIKKQIPCSLELTNPRDDYTAFSIQKSGMLEYCIEPSKGIVPARSKCTVIVTLQPRETEPNGTMCKDEFIVVRCAAVNEGFTCEDVSKDTFNKESGKLVDEVTLTVVIKRVDSIIL